MSVFDAETFLHIFDAVIFMRIFDAVIFMHISDVVVSPPLIMHHGVGGHLMH